jgi:hypothetical protein
MTSSSVFAVASPPREERARRVGSNVEVPTPHERDEAAVRREFESSSVDATLAESFPASDPPSWTGGISRVATAPVPDHVLAPLLERVRAEYLEMPGLRLTIRQAQRLWSLERRTGEALFRVLTDSRFLYRTDEGLFVLRDARV